MVDGQVGTATKLASWEEYVDLLKRCAPLYDLTLDPKSEEVRGELYKQFAMNLSLAYFMHFGQTPQHPDFIPFLNSAFMLQPNPDDTYYFTQLDSTQTYRIVGERGTVKLLTFTLTKDKIGMAEEMGPSYSFIDGDLLTLDAEGRFDFMLSRERPAGWTGDWYPLHPDADNVVIRQRSYDWLNERAARVAIECVTATELKPRPSIPYVDEKLRKMFGEFVYNIEKLWLVYNRETMTKTDRVNVCKLTQFPSGLATQVYWEAIYDIADDEALVLESDLPESRRYWNIQLNDELWNATEYVFRQSSLNGHQARVDSDGKFRAVISIGDPGVPNWLDTAGYHKGTLIGRWLECSSHPEPALKKVKLADVRKHLPADTPVVDPDQRREQLRQRRIGAQMRKRW